MRVKSVTYYIVCTNFMVESTGFGDRRTSALGKCGKEIYHSLKNIADKVECVGAV